MTQNENKYEGKLGRIVAGKKFRGGKKDQANIKFFIILLINYIEINLFMHFKIN